jgi:hypothetical protein
LNFGFLYVLLAGSPFYERRTKCPRIFLNCKLVLNTRSLSSIFRPSARRSVCSCWIYKPIFQFSTPDPDHFKTWIPFKLTFQLPIPITSKPEFPLSLLSNSRSQPPKKTCLTAAQDRKETTLQASRYINMSHFKVYSGCELICSKQWTDKEHPMCAPHPLYTPCVLCSVHPLRLIETYWNIYKHILKHRYSLILVLCMKRILILILTNGLIET